MTSRDHTTSIQAFCMIWPQTTKGRSNFTENFFCMAAKFRRFLKATVSKAKDGRDTNQVRTPISMASTVVEEGV